MQILGYFFCRRLAAIHSRHGRRGSRAELSLNILYDSYVVAVLTLVSMLPSSDAWRMWLWSPEFTPTDKKREERRPVMQRQ